MRLPHLLVSFGILLSGLCPLQADLRPKGPLTPIETDELGLLVVKVRLSAKKPGVPDRDFRFVLDTGASLNVVDPSIPSDYLWEEPEKPKGATSSVGDAVGGRVETRIVTLKRIELGGLVREDQLAYRMDLKGTLLGNHQDNPVDGIIGMNFLKGTRFVLDPAIPAIRWWDDLSGHRVALHYDESDHPALVLDMMGNPISFTVDTGSSSGIDVPGQADPEDKPEPFFYGGASGQIREGQVVKGQRVECGGKAWIGIPIHLMKVGEGKPNLGREVLWAAPLGLDLVDNWATFTLDAKGNLPHREAPEDAPLEWNRGGSKPRLQFKSLSAQSRWRKGGVQAGDEVLRFDALQGKALNLRNAHAAVQAGQALSLRVRRGGQELDLQVPERK